MRKQRDFKRPLLYSLIASVILGALLGIIVVLRNTWGWFEVRVILTTITVAVASLCGLACDVSRRQRGANLVPNAGLVTTLVSAGMILLGLWFEFDSSGYWKATSVVSIFAAALVQTCLLSVARLSAGVRWVFFVSCFVAFGLAVLLSMIIIWEINEEAMFRFVVAVTIVDGCFTLVIPMLHRIGKTNAPNAAVSMSLDQRKLAGIDQELASLQARTIKLEKIRCDLAGKTDDSG